MDSIRMGWQREFFQAPNEIYDRRDISGYAKSVFVYLCRRADDESRAFPAYARIADDVGFSYSTVRRAIEELTKKGLLHKEARFDSRGFQTSNIYTLIRPSSVPEEAEKDNIGCKKEIETKEEAKDALKEQTGCSEGAGRMLSENSPGILTEQPGCSVGTGRVSWENNEEYPCYKDSDYKDPKEKDLSVNLSVKRIGKASKEGRKDRRIDFSDYEQSVQFYIDKFGASREQVLKAMISVQDQMENGAQIFDSKAYFEKTLTQLIQEEDFRRHFV